MPVAGQLSGLVIMQIGSLLQGVIFATGGTVIALASVAAIRSRGYMRRIADNTMRYRLRSPSNVNPERLIPIIQGVFGVSAGIGAFVAVVGILSLLRNLH